MLLSDTYRFFIDFPLKGAEEQVYPINESLEFEERFDDKLKAWRYHLNTKLCFANTKDHMTYDDLYDMERQCKVCFRIPIRIEEYCNDQWTEHWKGYLPYKSGEWDNDACRVEIEPIVEDEFDCITQEWKNKKNLLEIEERFYIGLKGEIECIEWNFPQPSQPPGLAWINTYSKTAIKYQSVIFEGETPIPNGPRIETTFENQYCREVYNGTGVPTGDGWVLDSGTYVRPLRIISEQTKVSYAGDTTICYEYIKTPLNLNIDNGLKLQWVFEKFFENCDYGVCSDFFGFNEIGDAPDNYEYRKAAQYYHNIALFQASDVIVDVIRDENGDPINDIGSQEATIFCKKFCDFWESWSTKFGLIMFFDEQNNCMRIEHFTFPRQDKLLDLTNEAFTDSSGTHCLDGNRKYSYTKQDLPLLELFEDQIKTGSPDWDDASIEYNKYCSNDDDDTNEETYRDECTLSDLSKLYRNNDYSDDVDVLESVFALALDENYEIISIPGPITGNLILNGPMSWSAIIECLWLNERPQIYGVMNGQSRQFLSTKPVRKQTNIEICLLCEYWELFKPYQRVKSIIRHGYKDKGVIDGSVTRIVPGNIISFELLFSCD